MEEDHRVCAISGVDDLSFADVIKRSLAHDLGANHLEEYTSCQPLKYTFSDSQEDFLRTGYIEFLFNAFSTIGQDFVSSDAKTVSRQFFICSGLRAPPFRS